jgi:hypothetical protein
MAIVKSGGVLDGGKGEVNESVELAKVDIRKYLQNYGIKDYRDALYMHEFTLPKSDLRLDTLTLDLGTWVVRGFEIKSTRKDFRRDEKWSLYLPYLNYFYFATYGSFIKPEELPEGVGLLELHVEKPKEGERVNGVPCTQNKFDLKLVKRAKQLQPAFAKMTFSELYMTQILIGYFRKTHWRQDRRRQQFCQNCSDIVSGILV